MSRDEEAVRQVQGEVREAEVPQVMTPAERLAKSWADNAWTLSWGSIVIATALLLADQIESAQWMQVWMGSATGYFALRLVDNFKRT